MLDSRLIDLKMGKHRNLEPTDLLLALHLEAPKEKHVASMSRGTAGRRAFTPPRPLKTPVKLHARELNGADLKEAFDLIKRRIRDALWVTVSSAGGGQGCGIELCVACIEDKDKLLRARKLVLNSHLTAMFHS